MSMETMSEMTVEEVFEALDSGVAEVSCRLEFGELVGSGRSYTDEELASGAATGGDMKPAGTKKASAAQKRLRPRFSRGSGFR
jgi:hypothetical protein